MEDRDWLQNLKVGDPVCVSFGIHGDDALGEVKIATATQIEVGLRRYRRSDGCRRGDTGWSRGRIQRPTPDRVKSIHAREAASYLSNVQWYLLSRALLIELAETVKARRVAHESATSADAVDPVGERVTG